LPAVESGPIQEYENDGLKGNLKKKRLPVMQYMEGKKPAVQPVTDSGHIKQHEMTISNKLLKKIYLRFAIWNKR
jgi:hypothetical protein